MVRQEGRAGAGSAEAEQKKKKKAKHHAGPGSAGRSHCERVFQTAETWSDGAQVRPPPAGGWLQAAAAACSSLSLQLSLLLCR